MTGIITDSILLELRLEAERIGMSKTARMCGMEPTNLYKIISKGKNPSITSVARVASCLGLTLKLERLRKLDLSVEP